MMKAMKMLLKDLEKLVSGAWCHFLGKYNEHEQTSAKIRYETVFIIHIDKYLVAFSRHFLTWCSNAEGFSFVPRLWHRNLPNISSYFKYNGGKWSFVCLAGALKNKPKRSFLWNKAPRYSILNTDTSMWTVPVPMKTAESDTRKMFLQRESVLSF